MAMAGKLRGSFEDRDSSIRPVELLHDTRYTYYGYSGNNNNNNNHKKSNDLLSSSSMHQICNNSSSSSKPTSLRRKILRRFSIGASTASGSTNSSSSNPTNLRAMQQGLAVAPSSSNTQSDEFNMSKRPKTVSPERSPTSTTAERHHHQVPQRSKSSPYYPSSVSPGITTTTSSSATTHSKTPSTKTVRSSLPCSPQNYLDSLLRSRGYSTLRFDTLQTGYYNRPTRLQTASYNHEYFTKLLRKNDIETFRAMLTCGISSNPCNAIDQDGGSSLLHLCCRRGNFALLRILLHEYHVPCQVADVYGRTPLHECCCNKYNVGIPSFEAVEMLLHQDARLLYFCDDKGLTPLEYIPKSDWSAWMVFLRRHRDVYWPLQHDGVKAHNNRRTSLGGRGNIGNMLPRQQQRPPPLALLPPNSRPLPDPIHALPRQIAARVASGAMSPEEATQYRIDTLLSSCYNSSNNNDKDNTQEDMNKNDGLGNNDKNGRLDKLLYWKQKPQSEYSITSVATSANRSIASGLSSCSSGSNVTSITWDEQETGEVLRSLTAPLGTAKPIAWCGGGDRDGGGGGDRADHHHRRSRSRNYNPRRPAHVALPLKHDDIVPPRPLKAAATWCGVNNDVQQHLALSLTYDDIAPPPLKAAATWCVNSDTQQRLPLPLKHHDIAPPPLKAAATWCVNNDAQQHLPLPLQHDDIAPPPPLKAAASWCVNNDTQQRHPLPLKHHDIAPPPPLKAAASWCGVNDDAQHLYFR